MAWVIGIIVSIIAGAIIGFIARAIVPGKQNLSVPVTVGLGILGMVGGQVIGRVITPDNEGVPWIAGTIAAVLILFGAVKTGVIDRFES